MKIVQLLEGVEPKMPGAPSGIQIMTPQKFVAKAGDMPGEEEVDEAYPGYIEKGKELDAATKKIQSNLDKRINRVDSLVTDALKIMKGPELSHAVAALKTVLGDREYNSRRGFYNFYIKQIVDMYNKQGMAEDDAGDVEQRMLAKIAKYKEHLAHLKKTDPEAYKREMEKHKSAGKVPPVSTFEDQGVAEGSLDTVKTKAKQFGKYMTEPQSPHNNFVRDRANNIAKIRKQKEKEQGVAEDQEHLDRIRKLSGLDEATKLPASSREFGGDEFQDYMKRIIGTPDIDKKTGQVKTDKKGNEKYVSGKTKSDKYKLPYIHRSSVVEYLGPDGQTYDEDKIKQSLAQRPKNLLKQNEKMKHSNGELEQFFNIGFAALTGIALDEDTNKLIIVNTCPGAGSCKVDCFAMKGGKVQFKAAWQSDGRILTYLLNDPDGFFNQLSNEISKEEAAGKKGGYKVTIRWHDAGDFFSPEYVDMAFKLAEKHPDVQFYAYTKMGDVAIGKKPDNFIINWSEGAHTSQEKKVKAADPNLERTKNSRIVPDEIFQDLLVKDEKKNLVKGAEGQWQVQPDKLPELKKRLANEYGLSANSILSYDEWDQKTEGGKKETPVKYNVIITPGEPDITAKSHGVLSTLLLKH